MFRISAVNTTVRSAQAQGTKELDQLVSIGRAAALLDCHVETLRRWERAGRLPAVRTPGGQRRFRLADLRQVMGAAQ